MNLLNCDEQIPNNDKPKTCQGTYLFHLNSGWQVRQQQQYCTATEAGVLSSVKQNHQGLEFKDIAKSVKRMLQRVGY